MADEKSEEPTAKKKNESFSKGNFAKAEEVNATFIFIGVFALLIFSFPKMASILREYARSVFAHLHEFELTPNSASHLLTDNILSSLDMISPLLVVTVMAVIIAGAIQSGLRLTPRALDMNWGKFNPISGFQRIFSLKSLVLTGVDLLKFLAVGLVTWVAVLRISENPIFYTSVHISFLGQFLYETAVLLMLYFVITIGVIAIIHYAYQKWQTHQDMRMTKDEVKDENKQAEGDPLVKNAMRAMARRLLERKMMDELPTADVVVTNPTHFAVALRYERGVDEAPVVIAKGKNKLALKIKEAAKEHGVPMVENRPVARALYKIGNVGQAIPIELFDVVADILAFVYRTHKNYFHKLRQRREIARAMKGRRV